MDEVRFLFIHGELDFALHSPRCSGVVHLLTLPLGIGLDRDTR